MCLCAAVPSTFIECWKQLKVERVHLIGLWTQWCVCSHSCWARGVCLTTLTFADQSIKDLWVSENKLDQMNLGKFKCFIQKGPSPTSSSAFLRGIDRGSSKLNYSFVSNNGGNRMRSRNIFPQTKIPLFHSLIFKRSLPPLLSHFTPLLLWYERLRQTFCRVGNEKASGFV